MTSPSYVPLIAVVGPQGSGKSTLIKSMLQNLGLKSAKPNGSLRFDGLFGMQLYRDTQNEMNYIDCPGHTESIDETLAWASCADLTIVVVESDPAELYRAVPLLAELARAQKPHCIFINKVDSDRGNLDATISVLQSYCQEPLLVQQLPLHDSSGRLNGSVYLWDEIAGSFLPNGGEKSISIPSEEAMEEAIAREEFLENLANHDDRLLATLLEERLPAIRMLAEDIRDGLKQDHFIPVFFGSATKNHGIQGMQKLLNLITSQHAHKLLQSVEESQDGVPLAVVLQNGEMSKRGFASAYRVLRGIVSKGMILSEQRMSSLFVLGDDGSLVETERVTTGQVMFALKVEPLVRGSLIGIDVTDPEIPGAKGLPLMSLGSSNYPQTLHLTQPTIESGVERIGHPESLRDKHSHYDHILSKITQSIDRLVTENPCLLRTLSSSSTNDIMIWAQGPAQIDALRIALENRFGLQVSFRDPEVNYSERPLNKMTKIHGRYKHQTGGHGAFGDIVVDLCPLPRGSGIRFQNESVGGVIPKSYLPSIEEGLHEGFRKGKRGHPFSDFVISLVDGQTHAVDSSEMAFRHAGRLAAQAVIEQSETELLEPYVKIQIDLPELFDSQVMQQATALQGQIQDFSMTERFQDAGWNTLTLILPESKVPELIRQSKRLTQGLALVHCQELPVTERYRPVPS